MQMRIIINKTIRSKNDRCDLDQERPKKAHASLRGWAAGEALSALLSAQNSAQFYCAW